jgi:hypothetical protein
MVIDMNGVVYKCRFRSKRVLAVGKGDPDRALTSYGFP